MLNTILKVAMVVKVVLEAREVKAGLEQVILAVVHLVELEIQEMVVLVVMEELAVLAEMELMQLMLYMFMDMAAKVVPAELVDKLVWEALVVQQEPLVMMEVMVPLVQMVMLVQQEKLGIMVIIQREIIEL